MLVFAYGSLMWNPGFPHDASVAALAPGWRRSWCVPSTVHRGTPETPGMVLGLVPGGCCVGTAYKVTPGYEADAISYLDLRELAEDGYRRERIGILLPTGPAHAVCYVAARPCETSCEELASAAKQASGCSGRNIDYMAEAVAAIRSLSAPSGWPPPCTGFPDAAQSEIEALSGRFRKPGPPQAAEPENSA